MIHNTQYSQIKYTVPRSQVVHNIYKSNTLYHNIHKSNTQHQGTKYSQIKYTVQRYKIFTNQIHRTKEGDTAAIRDADKVRAMPCPSLHHQPLTNSIKKKRRKQSKCNATASHSSTKPLTNSQKSTVTFEN
jgi:hypothetical protein